MTRGQWGCMVAPVAGLATGVLGSVLPAAAWRACDVGVNGAANGFALTPETTEIPPDLAIGRDLVNVPESYSRTVVCGPVGI